MLYPSSIEHKLGFDQVKKWMKDHCQFEQSKQLVENLKFSSSFTHVQRLLRQTMDMKSVLELGKIPDPRAVDAVILLKGIEIEGTYLDPEDMIETTNALFSASEIRDHLQKIEDIVELKGLLTFVTYQEKPIRSIQAKFDKNGILNDGASRELRKLRKDLDKAHTNIRKSLDRVFKVAKNSGYIPENTSPTIRDGRLVIPVIASSKRKIGGFIHDQSSTGQTLYVEPPEVLEANNHIIELGYAEKREEIRILKELTSFFRVDLDAILQTFRFLAIVDFIIAKARFSMALSASMPELSIERVIHLVNARHPILDYRKSQDKRNVIPLDIFIGMDERIILISGPNAGGKSVCLKTVGLIQYMLQCGIPIPVDPDSKMGLVQDIFVDLGDEQSLENDLSTYSSHLRNMQHFLEQSKENTLILIDEFGTGTDPQFGGAIAEAILEVLLNTGCLGVITTHYGNLKEFAHKNKGIQNAAMQFDLKKLEPLYILESGRPGSSFALEVANTIGLNTDILEKARSIAGADSVELETLIQNLTEEKRIIGEKLKANDKREIELNVQIQAYDKMASQLEESKKGILDNAKREASLLLDQTNRNIEKTIRHIKENKAQKSETQKARKKLKSFQKDIKPGKPILEKSTELEYVAGPIREGDSVQVNDSGIIGEVLVIKEKSAKLLIGDLQTTVKLSELKKIRKTSNTSQRKPLTSTNFNISEKQREFSTNIDLRGRRAEEISSILEDYLDDAILLGHSELRILHGKGDGILREVVRTYLYEQLVVKNVQDEHVERGGAGISLVTLK